MKQTKKYITKVIYIPLKYSVFLRVEENNGQTK